jgi:hypothetical protein
MSFWSLLLLVAFSDAKLSVVWHAPFLSGGGYCSEAISYAALLASSDGVRVSIVQHGDTQNPQFFNGLDPETVAVLKKGIKTCLFKLLP